MEDVRSEVGLVSLEVAGASCSTPQFTGTVMASDAEVSNGFVKNGTSLPYVIETNKSGNRKRSSKILPVCGICGKKFVCVTTMKRHLVTHTGERPFNCKVCGKQYTQKGNLRVHERTHRNDRPFECNICHQKFYRKEPMQKHQWRQHGIGHYKSRPNGPEGSSTVGIIGAESVLYNSLVERIKTGPEGVVSSEPPMFETFPDPEVPEPASHTEIDNFSDEEDDTASSHSISRVVNRYINDRNEVEDEDHDDPKKSLEMLKYSLNSEHTNVLSTSEFENNNAEAAASNTEDNLVKPMKLKMKLAQAYLKEVKEEREREERGSRSCEGRDSFDTNGALGHIEENLGDITLSRNVAVEVVSPVTKDIKESVTVSKEVVKEKEYVECVCKACGSKCSVSDPYNFSCQHCNVKYTSLPTHMIADPLQCIGCLKVFEHKPAMKEHQSSCDKERPFVCCKCGYEFKQKAHLQKHQWRIHRRKLEPDPNVKEAEAILKAVNEMSTSGGQEMIMKQIIDRGMEDGLKKEPAAPTVNETKIGNLESFEGSKPLDLSPCKMYGSANSITQWVQQVETARTPIIPDISILKKPLDVALVKAQLPTEPLQLSQLQPSGLLPSNDRVSVTIQLLEPPKPQKFQHFAVKSKPTPAESNWRSAANAKDDNPLLNQKLIVEDVLPSSPAPIIYTNSAPVDRVYKRARMDNNGLLPSNSTHLLPSGFSPSNTQLHAADLSINQKLDFSPPSPPLNLSSKNVESEDLPFDYTITRSELIKGQLRRIRNQDERCGI